MGGSHHVPSTMDKHHYRVQCGAVTWDLFCILNKIKSRNRYTFVCTVHVFHYSTKLELKNMLQMKTTLKILTIKSNVFFLPLVQKYSCRDSPRSYWHFPCLELSPSHTTGVVDMLVCMLLHPIYPPKRAALVS